MTRDTESLDPRIARTMGDLTLVRHLFEGLTRTDSEGVPKLALASSFSVSEDQLTYTFRLRDQEWSNGDRVTADDFVYSWRKVLDPTFPTQYAHMLYVIKNGKKARLGHCSAEQIGAFAIDSLTLQVTLEKPTPYFLELLAFPTFFAINRNVDQNFPNWNSAPGKHFVCCGPFKLEKWLPDYEIILRKNENYWDASSVFLKTLKFSMIADNNTESMLFARGELDWLGQPLSNNISADLLGKMKEKKQLESYPVAGTFWLKCNVQKAPFNNEKIRKALSMAIPREEIIEHILQGSQSVALSPLPPPITLLKGPQFVQNDEIALLLFEEGMREMGWTRELFPTIEFKYSPSERNNKIVQFVQQVWQQLFQVPINLSQQEYQVHKADCRVGNYQIATADWIADFLDPLAFLEIFTLSSGMNDTNWSNQQFEQLIQRSNSCKPEERREFLRLAEAILVDEMPVMPLYHYAFDYAKKKGVEGVVLSPLGGSDFKTARIR